VTNKAVAETFGLPHGALYLKNDTNDD